MTETNTTLEQLKIGISKEEAKIALKPARVKIVGGKVEEVGAKKTSKLILLCKHPDKEEPISISAVKYENRTGKLEVSGLWMYKNKETGKLDEPRKGSQVAALMQVTNVASLDQLTGKEVDTLLGDDGYLCIKAY
jgi:hypothetical protein